MILQLKRNARLSLIALLLIVFGLAASAMAQDYNYIKAETLKADIEAAKNMIILDIQVEKAYAEHHIKGALPSYAYPSKSEADTAKLDLVFDKLTANDYPIVVVCPGGKVGATNTINYLRGKGIDNSRLLILENGQNGWPYPELLEQ